MTRDRDVVETYSNGLFHSTPWGNMEKADKARERMADLNKTIRWVINAIMKWETSGWPMAPIPKVCNSCSIEECSKRNECVEV